MERRSRDILAASHGRPRLCNRGDNKTRADRGGRRRHLKWRRDSFLTVPSPKVAGRLRSRSAETISVCAALLAEIDFHYVILAFRMF